MKTEEKNGGLSLLQITQSDQYKTVNELIEESRPTAVYYALLILSSFIIACGLLLNNAPVVIGGMLVTPILTPILVIALGIATGELGVIKNVSRLLMKSFFIIAISAFVMAILFGSTQEAFAFENTVSTAVLYFVVALGSGVAATFAWARKEIAGVLPGVSIAVALVPPLSAFGIWLATFNFEAMRFQLLVFLFNLVGIIVGSLVVFSLLKFYKTNKRVQEKSDEIEKEAEKKNS